MNLLPIRRNKTSFPGLKGSAYSELLREIEREVDQALDLQDVLNRILQKAVQLVGASDGSVMLLEDDGKLHFRARVGELIPAAMQGRTFSPGSKDEGVAGWVARNGQPHLCRNTKSDKVFIVGSEHYPIKSMVSVPIISHDAVLGVINVDSDEVRRFTVGDQELLVTMAGQVARAIERATLIEGLLQIGEKTLSGAKDLNQHIVDTVHRLTRCPVALWLVADRSRDCAELSAYRGLRDEYAKGRKLALTNSATGAAIATPQVVEVHDLQNDVRVASATKEEAAGQGWKSILIVPLSTETGPAIGTVSIYRLTTDKATSWEKNLLQVFAYQAAISMATARRAQDLHEEAQRLANLQKVTATISDDPSDLGTVIQRIAENLHRIFPGASCGIRLYNSKTDQFTSQVGAGLLTSIFDLDPRSGGTSRYVLEQRTPRYLEGDQLQHPTDGGPALRAEVLAQGTQATAYLPLLYQGEALGILYIDITQPYRFSEDDKRILQLYAGQAAIVIKNALLFAELETQRKREIDAIRKVGRSIAETRSEDEILKGILADILERMGKASLGEIRIYEPSTGELVVRASLGAVVGSHFARNRLGEGVTGWVAQNQESRVVGDISALREDEYLRFLGGTRSEIAVPLLAKDRLIGVLNVESPEVNAFDPRDLPLLEAIGDQAVIAIENVRLYGRDSFTSRFYEDIIAASLRDVDAVLDHLYKAASGAMELGDAQVQFALYDEQKNEVTFPLAIEKDDGKLIDVVRWGTRETEYRSEGEEGTVDAFRPRQRAPETRFGLTEYVIGIAEPVLITRDFEKQANALELGSYRVRVLPTFGRNQRPTHSWLGVPMKARGHVIGIISIQSLETEFAFDQRHVELLSMVANQAAVAIENARMYAELKRTNQQLLEVQEALFAQKQLATLGTAIAALEHRVNNTFNVIVPNVTRLRKRVDASDTTIAEILDIVERNARYTSDLLKRIQEPLRETSVQSVDINAVLHDVMARTEEKWSKEEEPLSTKLTITLDQDLPMTQAPIGQVTEVFQNLLDNAYRAMKDTGGKITVASCLESGIICVRVSDSGPGISDAIRSRLFEKPVPSKEPGGGSGLGLWLSRLMLQSLNGNVMIENTRTIEPSGTTMLVQIPVMPAREQVQL